MVRAVVLAALAAWLLAVGCGGGGNGGSIRYAETVVPIKHLDFDGLELAFQDYIDPPFAQQYPNVVATVNGEEITGKALASQEVVMELDRRRYLDDLKGGQFQEIAGSQLEALAATDPLEAIIDSVLRRHAVERLGLIGSVEDALEDIREQEANIQRLPFDERDRALETLRLQGLPTENWASSAKVVEAYRLSMGIGKLRKEYCDRATPDPNAILSFGYDCAAFLAQEWERADIVYYVRWAD